MKKTLILLFLLTLPLVFAQRTVTISMTDYPLKHVCDQLKQITFSFEGGMFEGTEYEDLTEFPPEVIEYFNNKIATKPEAVEALGQLGEITFSMEVLYNNSMCFTGSVNINNSELKYVKLEPDSLAGTNDEHIFLHLELYNLENILMEWKNIEVSGQADIGNVVGLFFKTVGKIISSLFGRDISIKPLSGFFKVIRAASAVIKLPSFENMSEDVNQVMIQNIMQQMQ